MCERERQGDKERETEHVDNVGLARKVPLVISSHADGKNSGSVVRLGGPLSPDCHQILF